jgi:hypothetical protein
MMSGWVRYLELTAKSKTGLSSTIFIWAGVAALGALATLFFLSVTAFVLLAQRFSPTTAALCVTGFYLLVTIVAIVGLVITRRRNITEAQLALAARSSATNWFDPKLMGVGLEIGRTIGWRRLLGLGAVGLLSAVLAREWSEAKNPPPPEV